MTNISQELEVLLAKYFKKYQPYDGEAEQTIEAIKQTLLAYIKELVPLKRGVDIASFKAELHYTEEQWQQLTPLFRKGVRAEAIGWNACRKEILKKAEENLGN